MNDLTKLHLPGRDVGGNEPREHDLSPEHDRLRSDGRPHDTGLVRPYRPCPADFRAVFLDLGQSKEIEEHYRTNWRVIRRWIKECGGDALRAERYAQSGGFARPNKRTGGRAARYVLGKTLSAKPVVAKEPRPAVVVEPEPVFSVDEIRARFPKYAVRKSLSMGNGARAKSRKHLVRIRELAELGWSLDEVAVDLGIKPSSLADFLRRKLGSSEWPPKRGKV